jgi:carboxypeptidase C (cathepsin A)
MWLLIALFICLASAQSAEADKVDLGSFYSGPALNFSFYAGYLQVGTSNFYYWFAESQFNPKTDPLVAFYNGGPGCSSVSGALTELGPFQPNADGTGVIPRETSWNKLANMLWFESPAGVGYSYTNGMAINSTYATDDHQTARNNLLVLQAWFARFPQYAEHRFYIAGESYAGTYIPTLTVDLLQANRRNSAASINLKGLMVGNPCTSELIDHNAFFTMVSTHDLISATLADTIEKECPPTFRYILDNSCCQFNYSAYPAQNAACIAALQTMYKDFASNNLYDIYSTCSGGPSGGSPCTADDALSTLMNNEAFRSVIHAASLSTIGLWYDCTPNLNYTSNYHSIAEQVWPTIFQLDSSLQVMIYSGDADACVPFFGTRQWTATLGGVVLDEWRPWYYADPAAGMQLAGYTIAYQQLVFTTLKGIGHMAPRERFFLSLHRLTCNSSFL